jgi:hypothetical protein
MFTRSLTSTKKKHLPPLMAPYGGRPVPRGADTSPTAQVVEEWFEEYNVVSADDGDSVLVFSEYYPDENDDGEVVSDEEGRAIFEDERHLRFYDVIKIHQRLHERGSSEQRNSRNARLRAPQQQLIVSRSQNLGYIPLRFPLWTRVMPFLRCVNAGRCNISQPAASLTTQE